MDILEFSTTTEIMKGAFAASKKSTPALTVARFAQRLGLGTSSLKMILSGKRKPSVHQMLCLARGLRLSPSSTAYLEALAGKESAQNNWERAYYSRILLNKKNEIKLTTISSSQADLLANTIILPLLVYLIDNPFTPNTVAHLAKELKVPEIQVISTITKLQNHEVLQKKTNGNFHVVFDKLNHRLAQKSYQKKMITEAARRIDTDYDSAISLFSSYAFSVSEKSLLQMQIEIKRLMEKYMADEENSGGRIVAQACFQIFPLIRPPEDA